MMKGFETVLTVAEGKRLIARGLIAWEPFRRARESGVIAVAKGTTNSYLVEELVRDISGDAVDKTTYVTGSTRPAKDGSGVKTSADMPDLVLRNGKPVEGLSATEAAAEMGPGDVFLKGANAINYALGQAAVLIGHPTGGTLGSALGSIVARKVRLVSPAGLEKEVPGDLGLVAAEARAAGVTPALWVMPSELFTEIEAIEVISGAEAVPVAAGGIGGAEGSVRLLVTGTDEEVAAAREAIDGVRGEPAFLG
ncbi:MAG: hypothetical protein ACYS9X_23305 [Planctomycetota bacterium]|jgi:hypothetical protein